MNTKTILGISLAATFAVFMIVPLAEAITDLVSTEVKDNKNKYQKITFNLDGNVVLDGSDFGGYAVFTTDGDVIAVTSHKGAFDSEAQKFNDPSVTFALCSPENLAAGLCGPEWHTHLVKPMASELCQIAKVGGLTFEEPSKNVVAKKQSIKVININKGTSSFTESVTGSPTDFTAGPSAVIPNPVTGVGAGVPFDLVPVFVDDALAAICIGPAAIPEE